MATAKKAVNKGATHQAPNAAQQCGAAALAIAKAQGLVWVPGYGYKGLQTKGLQTKYGLNYSQCYLAVMAACMPRAELVNVAGLSATALASTIASMRTVQGQSWGYIMARTGLSEGAVRKAFSAHTKVQTLGLRNGRGGRMATGGTGKPLAKLYQGGSNKALGTEVPVGKPLATATPTKVHKVAGKAPAPVAVPRKAASTK